MRQAEGRSLGGRLLVGVLLNLAMLALQLAGGLAAHSLALLSDAAHNGGDVAALLAVYAAYRVGRRPRSAQLTYAYGRWEVLVALINAVVLLAISAFIIAEAIGRLLSPVAVSGRLLTIVAAAALLGNAAAAWLLRGEGSVSARSAFLHLFADAAASAAVVLGGLLIWLAHLRALDAALSLAIAAWIIRASIKLAIEAGRILLEGVPVGLDLAAVEQTLLSIEGVAGIHDLHVWSVSSTEWVASAHLQLADAHLSHVAPLVDEAKRALAKRFGIAHATLEIECVGQECTDAACLFARPADAFRGGPAV